MAECITGVWHAKAINRRLWFIIGMELIVSVVFFFRVQIIEKKEKPIEDVFLEILKSINTVFGSNNAVRNDL